MRYKLHSWVWFLISPPKGPSLSFTETKKKGPPSGKMELVHTFPDFSHGPVQVQAHLKPMHCFSTLLGSQRILKGPYTVVHTGYLSVPLNSGVLSLPKRLLSVVSGNFLWASLCAIHMLYPPLFLPFPSINAHIPTILQGPARCLCSGSCVLVPWAESDLPLNCPSTSFQLESQFHIYTHCFNFLLLKHL